MSNAIHLDAAEPSVRNSQVTTEGTPINDLSNDRNLACIKLGQLLNEVRFRLEALWVQGIATIDFSDQEVPWPELRFAMCAASGSETAHVLIHQKVDEAMSRWRDMFGCQWHHESLLDANRDASPVSDLGISSIVQAVLRQVTLPSHELEQFSLPLICPAEPLVRLGVLLGRYQFPSPTEQFLTFQPNPRIETPRVDELPTASLILQNSADDLACITADSGVEWWLPGPPSRPLTLGEVNFLDRELDQLLANIGISMTAAEFKRRFELQTETDRPYLGICVENESVSRNGQGTVVLERQSRLLLEHFVRERRQRTQLAALQSRWQSYGARSDRTPSISSVRDAINNVSRAIEPLQLKIVAPTRGDGYVLLDIRDNYGRNVG